MDLRKIHSLLKLTQQMGSVVELTLQPVHTPPSPPTLAWIGGPFSPPSIIYTK